MTSETPVTMSQGYEVLPPKSGKAFPIPCNEWDLLKNNIATIADVPQLFHSGGMLLVGAALATFISLLTGAVSNTVVHDAVVIAWAIVAVGTICGGGCLLLAYRERRLRRLSAAGIVTQMNLIEQRFERGGGPAGP
jgi:hypothetical protein